MFVNSFFSFTKALKYTTSMTDTITITSMNNNNNNNNSKNFICITLFKAELQSALQHTE